MAVNFLDTPEKGKYGEQGYTASKKGLFSTLGDIMVKVGVGLESPEALAQLQQREMEAQMEFDKYRQSRLDLEQERKDRLAREAFERELKVLEAGFLPPEAKGTGLTGREGLVPIAGQFYQRDPMANLKTQLANEKAMADLQETRGKSQLLEKFLAGGAGEAPPGTTFNAGGFNIPLNPGPTADMRNAAVSTDQAANLIQDLQQQAQNLKGGYPGMAEIGKAFLNRGAGRSADYVLYQDSLPSAAVAFYRGVTGDTRLSDADAKARALPLLWKPSESEDVRKKKFTFLNRMVEARQKLLGSGKYPDGVIPISDLRKAADTSDAGGVKKFVVKGKTYNIPADQVEEFKKDMGIK